MNVVAFDYFLFKYGLKKIAETKVMQFIESCWTNKQCARIELFIKLYSLNDCDDFNLLINILNASEETVTLGSYSLLDDVFLCFKSN